MDDLVEALATCHRSFPFELLRSKPNRSTRGKLLFVRVELDVANNQSPPDNKTGLGELAMATASTPAHSTGAVGQTATSDVIANVWALTWVKSTQKIATATPILNLTRGLMCQTNRSIAPRILKARVGCKVTILRFVGRSGWVGIRPQPQVIPQGSPSKRPIHNPSRGVENEVGNGVRNDFRFWMHRFPLPGTQ
jgi:hypothetical protein